MHDDPIAVTDTSAFPGRLSIDTTQQEELTEINLNRKGIFGTGGHMNM